MKLSVVTPSFNSVRWLPACAASVRHAGAGRDFEHCVADGGSTDGTLEFLKAEPGLHWFSEPDRGMYDALNKGIARATGDVIGHLNADEQYNRAGLQAALALLEQSPALDAVFSPTVMVNAAGEFLQLFKQVTVPRLADALWHMPVQSCSLLYRKRVWERQGYDARFRLVADHAWFYAQMQRGLRLAVVREPIGIFTWRADNLSNAGGSEDAFDGLPRNTFRLKLAKHAFRLRKLVAGGYRRDPVGYDIVRRGAIEHVRIAAPALKLPPERLRGRAPRANGL
jgi:glycosyltransferase involved in cell wall biosynthesis